MASLIGLNSGSKECLMPIHMYREIEILKKKILSLCALVEESFQSAVKCIDSHDDELARSVITADPIIDEMEVEVEEDCLKLLALYQPVAVDLRYIIASLKINNDLERIGDLTVNIAEETIALSRLPRVDPPAEMLPMAGKVREMVRSSLDCLINLDEELAAKVCDDDDEVDALHRQILDRVQRQNRDTAGTLRQMLHYFQISHNLERIADHATNIAEDTIYMIEGDIIRHRHAES
jgi:phosphate transport system protein